MDSNDIRIVQMTSSKFPNTMSQQTSARAPTQLVEELDKTAKDFQRNRADIVCLATERDLEDFDDFSVAIERIRDPNDKVLDWDRVRRELLDTD